MLANGATFPSLKTVTLLEGYRGVVAESNLVKGANVISIPQHLFLTDRTAMKGSTLVNQMQEFLDEVINDHAQVYITLYLLEHMIGFNGSETGHSFFQPYFDSLPQSLEAFGSIPATWSLEELTLLNETSTAHTAAVSYQTTRRRDYAVFVSVSDSCSYLLTMSPHHVGLRKFLDLPPLIPLINTYGLA